MSPVTNIFSPPKKKQAPQDNKDDKTERKVIIKGKN
jgi:hypothetical protein